MSNLPRRVSTGLSRDSTLDHGVVAEPPSRPLSVPCPSSQASSRTGMPRASALASLVPAFSPATRRVVFALTLPVTFAPSCLSRASASSRESVGKVPVTEAPPPRAQALRAKRLGAGSSGACDRWRPPTVILGRWINSVETNRFSRAWLALEPSCVLRTRIWRLLRPPQPLLAFRRLVLHPFQQTFPTNA